MWGSTRRHLSLPPVVVVRRRMQYYTAYSLIMVNLLYL
jgi:hypothetical protein